MEWETVGHENICAFIANEFSVAVAGRTVLPDIVTSLNAFANASQALRFTYLSLSYKPFISLFNMTGVAETYPELAGIGKSQPEKPNHAFELTRRPVNYASAMTFELRQSTSGGAPFVRMNFKNGSDAGFTTYNMFGGQGDISLEEFTSRLEVRLLNLATS